MAASATLSFTGNLFSGELRLPARSGTSLFHIPKKQSVLFCLNGDQSVHYKFFSRMPKSKSLNFCNSSFALGSEADDGFLSNLNEDSDEMFDNLFKKHGKVVIKNKDQKSPTSEVDDDAESLAFAVAMAKVVSDVKAADIKVLFVKPLVYWTRVFIIATAFSRPQIDAIGSRIRDLAETKYGKVPNGDAKPNSWTLLDFGDVVIHIFLPQQRKFYNLEEFYGNATPIELPFENQPPSLS